MRGDGVQPVQMVTDFTAREIGQLFASRNLGKEEFEFCYSARNPTDVNTCAYNCVDGTWWALGFQLHGVWIAEHHLADRNAHEGWGISSGFWAPAYRGEDWYSLQAGVWKQARTRFEADFPHLFCIAFVHNPWADVWIRERCAFTKAGLIRKGVVDHHGQRQDVWAYAQREDDVGMCLEVLQGQLEGYEAIERP